MLSRYQSSSKSGESNGPERMIHDYSFRHKTILFWNHFNLRHMAIPSPTGTMLRSIRSSCSSCALRSLNATTFLSLSCGATMQHVHQDGGSEASLPYHQHSHLPTQHIPGAAHTDATASLKPLNAATFLSQSFGGIMQHVCCNWWG